MQRSAAATGSRLADVGHWLTGPDVTILDYPNDGHHGRDRHRRQRDRALIHPHHSNHVRPVRDAPYLPISRTLPTECAIVNQRAPNCRSGHRAKYAISADRAHGRDGANPRVPRVVEPRRTARRATVAAPAVAIGGLGQPCVLGGFKSGRICGSTASDPRTLASIVGKAPEVGSLASVTSARCRDRP
jgi:hypothetical protein